MADFFEMIDVVVVTFRWAFLCANKEIQQKKENFAPHRKTSLFSKKYFHPYLHFVFQVTVNVKNVIHLKIL